MIWWIIASVIGSFLLFVLVGAIYAYARTYKAYTYTMARMASPDSLNPPTPRIEAGIIKAIIRITATMILINFFFGSLLLFSVLMSGWALNSSCTLLVFSLSASASSTKINSSESLRRKSVETSKSSASARILSESGRAQLRTG